MNTNRLVVAPLVAEWISMEHHDTKYPPASALKIVHKAKQLDWHVGLSNGEFLSMDRRQCICMMTSDELAEVQEACSTILDTERGTDEYTLQVRQEARSMFGRIARLQAPKPSEVNYR